MLLLVLNLQVPLSLELRLPIHGHMQNASSPLVGTAVQQTCGGAITGTVSSLCALKLMPVLCYEVANGHFVSDLILEALTGLSDADILPQSVGCIKLCLRSLWRQVVVRTGSRFRACGT